LRQLSYQRINLDILDDELDIFEHEGVTENNISVGDKVVVERIPTGRTTRATRAIRIHPQIGFGSNSPKSLEHQQPGLSRALRSGMSTVSAPTDRGKPRAPQALLGTWSRAVWFRESDHFEVHKRNDRGAASAPCRNG